MLHFCHTCSLCRVELVVQFTARGSTQVLLCLFSGVLWLRHFLYSVGPYQVSRLHIYTFVVSRAFMAGAASQAGDADSSWAPGLTSGLQVSVNVHRGALLFVPQWQCISSFVFYITILSIRIRRKYHLFQNYPELARRQMHTRTQKNLDELQFIFFQNDSIRITFNAFNIVNKGPKHRMSDS